MNITLDTIMCEWCPESTPATTKARVTNETNFNTYVCNEHIQELASDFRHVALHPLNHSPEYTTLETEPNPMTGEWTVRELDLAAKYGAPYPVCGDLTTRKARQKWTPKSWVGHDPEGTQY